ncbi:hypothetical protein BGP77_05910 [Saccharospirillum sp. MSK14-1]|uniref:helix-turn-helix domain-containing protein n=1 Tax=Saccharospirillum sp. MSK14-1 TaxID=1897632 RepID=UPI000D362F84|nr:AraC family transcriptional regulator [Saccharospirillum sp. MSK14-1]PTY36819.1 hypothetical protein BGP77_05910 [Saccharospirillum sp. MSK14-1]
MLSIPLPFVVSLLQIVMAISLLLRQAPRSSWGAYFMLAGAATTAIVGLRWQLDWPLLRVLQPIMATSLPILAWLMVVHAQGRQSQLLWHSVAPVLIALSSLTGRWWSPPLDIMLTVLYLSYGLALWRTSTHRANPPENVPLSAWRQARLAIRVAGSMLLFSALIDGAISLDFIAWEGVHALMILTFAHAAFIPVLAFAVVWLSLHTETMGGITTDAGDIPLSAKNETAMDDANAEIIMKQVERTLMDHRLHLEHQLTLARLARKSGIPSRLISTAVNRVHQQNISQWVNRFRIEHAKQLLTTTQWPITEIFLESGFQTKSNFHREFSRLVGSTPTAYRESMLNADKRAN